MPWRRKAYQMRRRASEAMILWQRVIVDPELDQVIHGEIAEAGHLHRWRRIAADIGHAVQGLEHGLAHPVGAVPVTGGERDLQGRGLAPGAVDHDLGLRCRLVGEDDQLAVDGADLEGAPAELLHLSLMILDGHPVADLERILEVEDDPREQVAQDILQGEADHHRQNRR